MSRHYSLLLLLILLFSAYTKQVLAQEVWIPGWQQTSQMNTARAGAAVLEANGVIYAMGGIDGRRFLNSSEFSKIQPDGTLGPWQRGALLNDARGFFDAIEHNGFIYVAGGGKGESGTVLLRTIERTRINKDGGFEGWVTERNQLGYPRRCVKLFIANSRIYALGGFNGALLDTVESAAINKDGTLGEWRMEKNSLTMPRYINSVKVLNGITYAIGGHAEREGSGLTEVEFARTTIIGANTAVDDALTWQKTTAMQAPRYALSSVSRGDHLYAIGGLNGAIYSDAIELTQQSSDGELGEWRYTTPLASLRANFGSVIYHDRIYIIGGTNRDGYYSTVEYATLDERGDIGFWGSTQQLKEYQQQQQAREAKLTRQLPNSGVITEVIQTRAYSYLHVTKGVSEQWLAGPRGEFRVGEVIEYSRGTTMVNFHSSSLNRRFSSIIFVEHLRLGGEE